MTFLWPSSLFVPDLVVRTTTVLRPLVVPDPLPLVPLSRVVLPRDHSCLYDPKLSKRTGTYWVLGDYLRRTGDHIPRPRRRRTKPKVSSSVCVLNGRVVLVCVVFSPLRGFTKPCNPSTLSLYLLYTSFVFGFLYLTYCMRIIHGRWYGGCQYQGQEYPQWQW